MRGMKKCHGGVQIAYASRACHFVGVYMAAAEIE